MSHTEHLKFICKSCPEKFVSEEQLQKHVDYVHNKPRPFECPYCDKSFAFKQGLERHMVRHDPSQNLHACEICNESFPTLTKLQQHLPKHAGKRRYPCKYCPKSFLLSHHLTRHVRNTHNTPKGQSPKNDPKLRKKEIICTTCGETFKSHETFIKHTAEHASQDLVCPLCKIKFDSVETMDTHVEEHALATQHFTCELCSVSYLLEEQWDQHFAEEHNGMEVDLINLDEEEVVYEEVLVENSGKSRKSR